MTLDIVGPAGAPRNLGNAEFLEGVVGAADWRSAHVTGFASDPDDKDAPDASFRWTGAPWSSWTSEKLSRFPGMNAYFSISLFTGNRRLGKDFKSCHAIVLDDVGVKADARDVLAILGDPSWRVETSPGNEQWGYILAVPETNRRKVEALIKALVAKGLTDPAAGGVERYARLPASTNTKARHGGNHPAVPREWVSTRKFATDDLLRQVGAGGAAVPGTGTGTGTSGRGWRSQADLAGGDHIVRLLDDLGYLGETRTSDGQGWHLLACPWDHEHTVPGDNRAAVYLGGNFKCFHGHCAHRRRPEFLAWLETVIDEASGGVITSLAQLEPGLEPIDPASVLVPKPDPNAATPPPAGGTSAAPSDARAAARAFLREMIWVREQAKFFSRHTHGFSTVEGVDGSFQLPLQDVLQVPGPGGKLRELSPSRWFMRHRYRTEVHNVTYWPGEGEVFNDPGDTRIRYANRWRPCVLGQDAAKGPPIANWMVKPWLDLVRHVLGAEGPRFIVRVLDWMALIVTEPGVKPGWHLIVQGAQGIGKDLMMLPVVFAVGAGNVGMVSAAGLHRPHNPWAEKRLVLVSELKQTSVGSASGRDQYNTLKALTENTSPTVPINEKNVKLYHARNVSAFYVTSNEHDALALDADDRRFVVAASTAAKWPGDRYAHLVSWLGGATGHGSETVAAWLRQREARMPAARRAALMGNAFNTASKRAMVDEADPVRAWTREQIEDGAWPDLMTSAEIDDRYRSAVRQKVFKFAVPAGRWGRLLREFGGGKVYGGEPVRLVDGRKTRVWAVRGLDRFAGMGEPQIARAYKGAAVHAFEPNGDVVVFPGSATPATDET